MEEFPLSSMAASGPIKDAVCFCLPLASISSVHLKTDLAAKNAIVKSNALRLQQVLINLVSNAIKYTKRGSDIVIKIHATTLGDVRGMVDSAIASCRNNDDLGDDNNSSVLVFSVSDRGPGIALDQADRLFRRYARLDQKPTRTLGSNNVGQPSGTGLGLHLCKLFVERMNGRIWATNNPEDVGGTTFSFYLPLISYAAHDFTEDLRVASGSRVSDGHSKSSGKRGKVGKKKNNGCVFDLRVLLVDDTLINRKVLSRMLKKIGICNLVTVESGKHALEELSKNPFDLVVTDLQMPVMDGTELSAIIRDRYKDSATPIVVGLTADTSTNAVERCSKSGMSDVLHKPITSSEMKDYLETTVPSLKRGVWRNTATTAYDSAHDEPGTTSKSSLKAPIQIH
jgi:CheY-like chemotaxis protein